jgi:hypothetical protein
LQVVYGETPGSGKNGKGYFKRIALDIGNSFKNSCSRISSYLFG